MKKRLLASLLALFNLVTLGIYVRRLFKKEVTVLAYHRVLDVGNYSQYKYDRELISATPEMFDAQLQFLKRHYDVIDLVTLNDRLRNNSITGKELVITFDDGYLDNYTEALPILEKHQASAVFYLTTTFLDSKEITWWDEVAYLLRKSHGMTYQLPNGITKYHLEKDNIDKVIQIIMTDIKQTKSLSVLTVLDDMRMKFPIAKKALLAEEHQLFMGWEQAKALLQQGMEIGSHTLTHPILSQLTNKQHQEEVVQSKRVLEEKLQCTINSIAYPVGRYYCYNEKTFDYTAEAGYKIAFNNEPGFHRSIDNVLDINRFCVATNDLNYLKYECCFT